MSFALLLRITEKYSSGATGWKICLCLYIIFAQDMSNYLFHCRYRVGWRCTAAPGDKAVRADQHGSFR